MFEKASALFQKLVNNHPFVDGNKRTAVIATARFLFLNECELTVLHKNLVGFTVSVVEDNLRVEKIAGWLKENSEKAN